MNYRLFQHIKSAAYSLPYVGGGYDDEYHDYYHAHFDDGEDHYTFGGEDYGALIKIDGAFKWSLGSKDYKDRGWLGDSKGTYVPVELPYPVYLVVEAWADGGSYPDYPEKVRLATPEEIALVEEELKIEKIFYDTCDYQCLKKRVSRGYTRSFHFSLLNMASTEKIVKSRILSESYGRRLDAEELKELGIEIIIDEYSLVPKYQHTCRTADEAEARAILRKEWAVDLLKKMMFNSIIHDSHRRMDLEVVFSRCVEFMQTFIFSTDLKNSWEVEDFVKMIKGESSEPYPQRKRRPRKI